MRLTGTFGLSISLRCQLIDSPSRSGSVASITCVAPLSAVFSACTYLRLSFGIDVIRLEVAFGVDAEPSPLLLADLVGDLARPIRADRGRGRSSPAPRTGRFEKSLDRPRLGGRLHDHECFRHIRVHPNTICQPARTGRRRPARTSALQFQLEQPRQQTRRTAARIARQSRPDRSASPGVRQSRIGSPADRRRRLLHARRARGARRRIPSSSRISSADSTIFAPSRSSACAPRLRPLSTLPGTASTSRPCSSAQRAVISEPLFSPASMTTTARDRPLMMRLRSGKNCGSGGVPGTSSLTTRAVLLRCRAPAARARADTRRRRPNRARATRRRRRRQRAAMRRRVDAARQAADDRRGRAPRDRAASRSATASAVRRTPRASRQSRPPGALSAATAPAHPQHRRRIGDRRQRRRDTRRRSRRPASMPPPLGRDRWPRRARATQRRRAFGSSRPVRRRAVGRARRPARSPRAQPLGDRQPAPGRQERERDEVERDRSWPHLAARRDGRKRGRAAASNARGPTSLIK